MKWREEKTSNLALVALALFSVLVFYVAEQTAEPERQANFEKKLQSAKLTLVAREAIKSHGENSGIRVDVQNDPYRTGIIGQERSPITSDRGIVTSKILATNPNFAAVFVEMLVKAKIKKHNIVAVGMTGSFPGWNIAFLSACTALEIRPIIITSVGSSDWGANLPTLTWLDMERVLGDRGLIPFKSVAASIGGGADNGRGLSPEGRDLIREAIRRNGVKILEDSTLEKAIAHRMDFYREMSKGKPIAAYVNIGGGVASLGGSQNARLIPAGLTQHLAVRNFPVHAVINQFAEQGLPVINLSSVEEIAARYGLPVEVGEREPELGEGPLFFKDRYSIVSTTILTALLGLVVFVIMRLDVRHYLLRRRVNSVDDAVAS
jgi:poly-gamma-glutamate system protein